MNASKILRNRHEAKLLREISKVMLVVLPIAALVILISGLVGRI